MSGRGQKHGSNKRADRKAKSRKRREQTAAAIRGGEIMALGLEAGPAVGVALTVYKDLEREVGPEEAMGLVEAAITAPEAHRDDARVGLLADAVIEQREARAGFVPRVKPAPATIFGEHDSGTLEQLQNARDLPVSYAAALMPDGHVGFGLPIGGVLATINSVIPYAVGVDIACRMRLTVFDTPASEIDGQHQRLCKILERETLFGTGAQFKTPHDHEVMDEDKWQISDIVRSVRDRAGWQLGSSGSGNHFASFDNITFPVDVPELGMKAGEYMCLLTHSGSRGAGARIADYYSKLAMSLHPELPKELQRLAWLNMDSEAGLEYFAAMNLMGEYAAANHQLIHEKVTRALGDKVRVSIENHHNFCIPGDALVATPTGPQRMGDLKPDDEVYAMDPVEGLVPTRVLKQWRSGVKPILNIRTAHRALRCSPDHPLLVLRRIAEEFPTKTEKTKRRWRSELVWVKASDLVKGDLIVCAEGYGAATDDSLTPAFARLLGAFTGDGWRRHNPSRQGHTVGLAIGGADEAHTDDYLSLVRAELPHANWNNNAPGAFGLTCSSVAVSKVLLPYGVLERSRLKRVPKRIFSAPREIKMAYLAGYADADGSVSDERTYNHGRLSFGSTNHELIREVRELAISCGLQATNISRALTEGRGYKTSAVWSYKFTLDACSTAEIELWHEKKSKNIQPQPPVRRRGLGLQYTGVLNLPEGLFVERVQKIELDGVEEVYDISVEHDSHSFVCEGVLVHNCWEDEHGGEKVYVHRKGATPAGAGVLGVIPGSMAAPGYLVRGKGEETSLRSASHGAGRAMSRTQAKNNFRWAHVRPLLEERKVTLLSAGIDEVPGAYKDIEVVMEAQTDLVERVARFDPRIVKMAPAGEKPED